MVATAQDWHLSSGIRRKCSVMFLVVMPISGLLDTSTVAGRAIDISLGSMDAPDKKGTPSWSASAER